MKLYYFSGTGNSLFVAKQLAKSLDATLVPIAKVINNEVIKIDEECAGFIFPTYFASNLDGLPLIVKRFAKKLTNIEDKYLFAINTSEHTPGATLGVFNRLIKKRGGKLSSGFTVNMSQKSLKDDILKKSSKVSGYMTSRENSARDFDIRIDKKISEIIVVVSKRKNRKIETTSLLMKLIMFPLRLIIKLIFRIRYMVLSKMVLSKSFYLSFEKLLPKCGKSFVLNDKCIGCSVCVDICPVDNIEMLNEKPIWHSSCENCLACYVWCPQNAIEGEIVKYNENRHHPDIKLYDMID